MFLGRDTVDLDPEDRSSDTLLGVDKRPDGAVVRGQARVLRPLWRGSQGTCRVDSVRDRSLIQTHKGARSEVQKDRKRGGQF